MPSIPPESRGRSSTESGFTLLEMMAVLVVLAILAGLSSDAFLVRRKRANRQTEAAELSTLSEAWLQAALRTRSLPSDTNWVDWLAVGCALPVQRIARNASGGRRQLVYDPEARFGRPPAPCPFVQVATGSLEPIRPRLVLVSSLGDDLPDLRTLSFDSLWTNAPGAFPSGWPTSWAGESGDLLLERLDLRGRFQRLVLHNLDSGTNAPYAVSSESASIPVGGRMEGWFLVGSMVELRSADGSAQASEVIQEADSYVFERRRWSRRVTDGPTRSGGMGDLADQFLASPLPSGAGRSATDRAVVVDAIAQYFSAYANWGAQGFPSAGSAGAGGSPLLRSVVEAQARLRDFSRQLIQP